MARKPTLGELRDALILINREIVQGDGNGEATNSEVLKRIRADKAEMIRHLTDQLVDRAIIKLLNEVSGRKRNLPFNFAQSDLFVAHNGIPHMVSVAKGVKRSVARMTIREMADWIKAHDTKAVADKNKALKRLLAECREHMESEDDTLEIALSRK